MKAPRDEQADLVVVGAGPAGSTLATLVKMHHPKARVVILEAAPFPRHHIGESLLPGMVPILRETGVYDRLQSAGFPLKVGVTYVWGKDRKPWHADINEVAMEYAVRYGKQPDITWTWQVERAKYDAILLDHAREKGVEVICGRAQEPIDENGRVAGVVFEAGGKSRRLRSRLVADCSGRTGFLPQLTRARSYRPELHNLAGFGYFRGAKWKFSYTGHPDKTSTFICSVPEGWFWYIPISADVVSVGLVCKAEYYKRSGTDNYQELYWAALKRCREIWPLVKDAAVEKGMDPADPKKDFFTTGDWSFSTESSCGPGWLGAGDSVYFIDPLLSSGVVLATLGAHRAAYTISTAWRHEHDAPLQESLWADYRAFCSGIGSKYLTLIRYWYHEEPAAREWWGGAGKLLDTSSPLRFSPKSAFVAVTNGINSLFERAYLDRTFLVARDSGDGRGELKWGKRGVDRALRGPFLYFSRQSRLVKKRKPAKFSVQPQDGVILALPAEWSRGFVPIEGTGDLGPVWKAVFGRPVKGLEEARHRRILPLLHRRAIELMDGSALGDLGAALCLEFALPVDVVIDQLRSLVRDLAEIGVVRIKKRTGSRGKRPPASFALTEFREGESLLSRGRCREAAEILTGVIAGGAGKPWILALRGEARRHQGDFSGALADLDEAVRPRSSRHSSGVERISEDFESRVERGWILDRIYVFRAKARLAAGDRAGAGADLEAALALNPAEGDALRMRAELAGRAHAR